MEDYYKMIGTNEHIVTYSMKGEKRTDKEKLEFIKEKYEYTLNLLKMKQDIAIKQGNLDKLIELSEQIIKVTSAYQKVESSILGQTVVKESDEMEITDDVTKNHVKKTPYEILNFLEESMQQRTDQENDERIKQRKESLINAYQRELEGNISFKDRIKIEQKIKEIEEAYEMIKTADKRELYNKQEQEEQTTPFEIINLDEEEQR